MNLYAASARHSTSIAFRQSSEASLTGRPVQRPLAHQRVLLSRRVIAYYGLIRTSQRLPLPYFLRPAGLCPTVLYGLAWRDSPFCSVCLLQRAISSTPAPHVAANDCSFTTCSSLRLLRTGSTDAAPSQSVHARICVTRLASSLPLRPAGSLALHRQGRLLSSFRRIGHPISTSSITTGLTVNSLTGL